MIRFRKRNIIFFLAVVLSSVFSIADGKTYTDWISQEGMKAGYLYCRNDTKNFNFINDLGLNTIILKEDRFRTYKASEISDILNTGFLQWAKKIKKEGFRLFLALNWRQYAGFPYRRAVFSDGIEDNAPCPIDSFLWKMHLPMIIKIAIQNLEKEALTLDGIFLDTELYSPLNENYRTYKGAKVCYCDGCFRKYLMSKTVQEPHFLLLQKTERYQWLLDREGLDSYQKFLSGEIEALAAEFTLKVRKYNPNLLIGMYPSVFIEQNLDDWVLLSIARGLGSKTQPVLIFETTTYGYYGRNGHTRIPQNTKAVYEEVGIYGKFIAGYLLRLFSPFEIENNLFYSAQKASGYWLFRLPMLWGEFGLNENLYSGQIEEYRNAIKNANENIDKLAPIKNLFEINN